MNHLMTRSHSPDRRLTADIVGERDSAAHAGVSRREFMRYAGIGAALVGTGAVTACTSNSTATLVSNGKPVRGGTLRAGITGGGPTDTIDGQAGLQNTDFARVFSLYNPLVGWDLDANVTLVLAESMEPDAANKTWTVRLRSGVEFHNGKTLNADDVIYSLNRVIKQKTPGYFAVTPVDAPNMKKIDPLTLRIPMKTAYPLFPEFYCSLYQNLMIVPVGYNPAQPVGTGPFKFQSFTPGQESTFARNPNYWRTGQPYVDTLVITDYSDETAQINGLLSNQVDCVNLLSDASLPRLQSSGARAVIAQTGCNTPFTMRVDVPPFNDVRVRQALRLIVDRPQMNTIVWGDHATVANDLFAPYDPNFNHSIPQRVQDISQAKSLLKAAGHENLNVTLVTADIFSGVTSSAQVFAQQATAAGVTVNLQQITTTEFYGPNFLKWPFAPDFWYYTPYLSQVAQEMLPTSPFNDTSWNDPHYTSLYQQAFATPDDGLRAEIVHEMQAIDHTSGGLIIPVFTATIDGVAARVQGVKAGKVGFSFGNYNFEDMWLT